MRRSRILMAAAVVIIALLLSAALLVDADRAGRSGGDSRGAALPEPAETQHILNGALTPEAEDGMSGDAAAVEPSVGRDADASAGRHAAPDVDVASGLRAPELDARIVRTGSITLRLKDGRFEAGWSDAQAVAGAFGGYVVNASRSGVGDGPRSGSITMRVPSERFDRALDRLRDLSGAKVERLDVASEDVTQEFVDVRSRLRHDRAVEGRLLALLARTKGVSEVLAVQSRLDQVQEEIEVSRGRLQYLEKMTSMSTIEVALREPGAARRGEREDRSTLGEAWSDARERFMENVAAAVVWTGGALPVLLLLGVIAGTARIVWRRATTRRATARTPESTS